MLPGKGEPVDDDSGTEIDLVATLVRQGAVNVVNGR